MLKTTLRLGTSRFDARKCSSAPVKSPLLIRLGAELELQLRFVGEVVGERQPRRAREDDDRQSDRDVQQLSKDH